MVQQPTSWRRNSALTRGRTAGRYARAALVYLTMCAAFGCSKSGGPSAASGAKPAAPAAAPGAPAAAPAAPAAAPSAGAVEPSPAPGTPAPGTPAPDTPTEAPPPSPATATASAAPRSDPLLDAPKSAAGLERWSKAQGCPWAAEDGSEVLCWWQRAEANGSLTIGLRAVRAPGKEIARFELYHAGVRAFSAAAVRPDGIRRARLWLGRHRARRGEGRKMPVKITHDHLKIRWQGVEWGMKLRPPPKVAPTTKLGGREGLCCRWQPADATFFNHCGLLSLRLQLDCDWHQTKRDSDDVCADPDWRPPAVAPARADTVFFFPVGRN